MTLEQPTLKASRAHEHLQTLEAQLDSFVKSKSYHISTKEDAESGKYVITVRLVDAPTYLALYAGDFLLCLRSALDYLAWQLAVLGCAPNTLPERSVGFPVFGTYNAGKTEKEFDKLTLGIPDEAVSKLKDLQPYNHGNRYKLSLLWRLHEAWNIVKHRHIAMHSHTTDVLFLGIKPAPSNREIIREDFYDGCKIRIPLAYKPEIDLYPVVSVGVTFGDANQGLEFTISEFRQMYDLVALSIIPSFAGFFPATKAGGKSVGDDF